MNDTKLEISEKIHKRYMQMDGQERLLIGMQMFESARKIALSSFPKDISENERRRLLCERFYGRFSEKAYPK